MSLAPSDIDRIAHLARLALPPEAAGRHAAELSRILDLVEQMNSVDTSGVEPMAHPLRMAQRPRPDQVTETDRRADFQSLAPQTADGLYLVPKVID